MCGDKRDENYIHQDGHSGWSGEIGPRMKGSDGDKRAADYIRSYFESLGLEVWEQSFDVEYASLIDHKVEILEPPLGEIPSSPLAYIHTSDDTIDLIDVAQLEQIGAFVDAFLLRTAARARAWPFERQIPERLAQEVEKMMGEKG